MASYHLLQHTKPASESPAKIFAKLKSRVQREAMRAKDSMCVAREARAVDLNSPGQRADLTTELKENQGHGSYRGEVRALTLSPIATPRKNPGYSFSDIGTKYVEDVSPEVARAFMSRNGHTPSKGAFLESTAVSHPLTGVNREQPQTWSPAHRGAGRAGGVFELHRTPLDKSPVRTLHPAETRLRKRKWEQQDPNSTGADTGEPDDDSFHRFTGSIRVATCREDLGDARGLPADRPEGNQLIRKPLFPVPRPIVEKRCIALMGNIHPMSPAKMFAYMKERESKKEQQEVHEVSSSTRELFNGNETFHQSRDAPLSAPDNGAESAVPVNCSSVESADSRSDPHEVFLIPPAPPEPVLLEDPLVLNSPRISIPKKQQSVFKRNNWPQRTKFPNENVIYLKSWFLRKNHNGLFVDGTHCKDNIPWNSNIIVERVSNSVVKTVSGRIYILVGKMKSCVESGFPSWFIKKFVKGFPPNWKVLFEKFLSESRDNPSRETERIRGGRSSSITHITSEASSINLSVKRAKQKPFKTPSSCPPAESSSAKVSRSGRIIKPPLEYWKGGRVILDAHMNVTIHECYDTSICIPEVTTTVSTRKSPKPARVFLPCSEGSEQSESANDEKVSVPLRKVKASCRKHNRAKVKLDEKPSNPPEPPVETSSSEEPCGRITRSSVRSRVTERLFFVDTVSEMQKEPEKASTQKSKKQPRDTNMPSKRGRRRTAKASSGTSPDKTLESSDKEFENNGRKKKKGVYTKRDAKVLKSQPSYESPSSQSAEFTEDSGKKRHMRIRVSKRNTAVQPQQKAKQSRSTKVSPPTQPLPSRTHKAKKGSTTVPEEPDENEWTETELMRLEEAVSYYPKHMAGYWAKVAGMVGTRSAEECHNRHTSQGTSQSPVKRAKKSRKEKGEAPRDPVTDHPVISARVGTLKRKQQVRQFLEAMPREDVDDVFSSAYMQNKRFEMPSICPSEDHDFAMSDLEPLTPMSKVFPEVKTPQCLHITPGMMGSPNRNHDDKYVYQLQKRMKKNQFNVCKQARPAKNFTPSPSVKQTMRRCGKTENDTFLVWEMFPGKDAALSESGEEDDFYFSEND